MSTAKPVPVHATVPTPGIITTVAGSAASGAATSIGQAPFAISIEPSGSYTQPPTLLVGDVANPVVRTLDTTTGQEGVIAGNDAFGFAGDGGNALSASMSGAGAVVQCGPGGPIYVADTFNFRIRQMTPSPTTTVIGSGVQGYKGDGGPATSAEIGEVYGMACGNGGHEVLFFADGSSGTIRLFDNDGNVSTLWYGFSFPTAVLASYTGEELWVADAGAGVIWYLNNSRGSACVLAGIGPRGYNCNNGAAARTALNVPWGLSSGGGGLLISEAGANRIRQIDQSDNLVTIAGTGAAGFSGDGGPALQATLNSPTTIDYSGATNTAYIADYGNNRIRAVDFGNGRTITTIAGNGAQSFNGDGVIATSAQLGLPYAVAGDAAGSEFVADNLDNAIRKIDPGGVITTIAGRPVLAPGFGGDGGAATSALLNDPRGVAVDSAGNVYVSDTGNQRIRKVDHVSGFITTIAGTGVAGYSGDGGLATAAKINSPRQVWVDGVANVYIADTGNHRIRKIDHSTGTMSTVAGNGSAGLSGDGLLAIDASLSGPRGVALNALGDIFISDTGNNRVRKVDHTTSVITTVVGSGLNFPFGLAFDGSGSLFIADSGNQRIRVMSPLGKLSTLVGACGVVAGFSGDGGLASLAHVNYPYGVAVDGLGNILIADVNNNRVRGIVGPVQARSATCPSGPGSPRPRGTTQVNPSPPPPPRIADQGPRVRLAARVPPSAHAPRSPRLHLPSSPIRASAGLRRSTTRQGTASAPISHVAAPAGTAEATATAAQPRAVTRPGLPDSTIELLLAAMVLPALLLIWRWRRSLSRRRSGSGSGSR